MSAFDAFRYDGKRALVVGGATGKGAAAELAVDAGASEVVVPDVREITSSRVRPLHVDLAERAIAGLTSVADVGWLSSADTGSLPPAAPIAATMLNRPAITGVSFDPAAFGVA